MKKQKSNFGKILYIIKTAFRFCLPYILVNVITVTFTASIGFLLNIINKNMINELSASVKLGGAALESSGIGKLSAAFIGMLTAYIFLYLFNWASGFLNVFGRNFYSFKVDLLFQKIFMWKTYKAQQESFFSTSFAEMHSFAAGASQRISNYINMWIQFIFGTVAAFSGTIVIFAIYEPWFILYIILLSVCTGLMFAYIAKKQYQLDKKQVHEQRFADYYQSLLTSKANAKELRIYKTKDHLYDKWINVYDKLRTERLSLAKEQCNLNNIHIFVRFTFRIISVTLLAAGAYFKRYDIGTFVMLFGLIETCSAQASGIANMIASGAYRDVKYICDYYDYISPITVNEIKQLRTKTKNNKSPLPYGEFRQLELENVYYSYPNSNSEAVSNVSLHINKGEIISILGYNGSGKTTLSKLMNGSLIPREGSVKLNGIPLSECNQTDFFKYYGNAPQEFSRFSISLRDNVGLGHTESNQYEAELNEAYDKAGIKDLINKYPGKDNTILGKEYDENGVDMSGGEWQKLIIAAAYMGTPEILLMDEPSASIDPLKELELLNNLRKNLKGKTAVLISHRIGFARLADRIIMMQNGEITEEGTHDELLAQNGYYARLFNEQKKLYEGGEE